MKKCEEATMCGLLHYLPNEFIEITNQTEQGVDQTFGGEGEGYRTVCVFCSNPVKCIGFDKGTLFFLTLKTKLFLFLNKK